MHSLSVSWSLQRNRGMLSLRCFLPISGRKGRHKFRSSIGVRAVNTCRRTTSGRHANVPWCILLRCAGWALSHSAGHLLQSCSKHQGAQETGTWKSGKLSSARQLRGLRATRVGPPIVNFHPGALVATALFQVEKLTKLMNLTRRSFGFRRQHCRLLYLPAIVHLRAAPR